MSEIPPVPLCDPPPSMVERAAAIRVMGSIGRIVGAMRQTREAGRREAGARMIEACELLQDAREAFHSLENPDWDAMVRRINRFLEDVIGDKKEDSRAPSQRLLWEGTATLLEKLEEAAREKDQGGVDTILARLDSLRAKP